VDRQTLAETPVASVCLAYQSNRSETRVVVTLLVCALFLQRFSLPFGETTLQLDLVPVALILLHQFLSGKLLIQYDRLFWFLGVELAITCSLLLNFRSTMLTSYFLFMVVHSLVTLSRPSTPDQYKSALQAFQFLVMLLSCLAVAQFVAQFVVDGRELIRFYGMVPDFLLTTLDRGGLNTIHPMGMEASSLLKSNGIFLGEPSTLSQVTALGILIEVLEFRRPRYLIVMALGFLMAYSGTGLMILLFFLPIAGLRHGRAGFSALLVIVFALGLFATGIIDLSVFVTRVGEFEETRSSGFQRFVTPFWLAAKHLDTGSLQAFLVGSGPGTVKTYGDVWWGGNIVTWLKMFYEYGIIGSSIYVCFLASCFRRSRCPGVVLAAIIFTCLFEEGFLVTWFLTIMIVLCTLHGPEPRRGRIDKASGYEPSLVTGSAAV
jgi:hypothetical protein